MRVVLATNEPWGTYHAEPLVDAAAAAGIELTQWCPDRKHLPSWPRVTVETDPAVLARADLVAVNGLLAEHTLAAARAARTAGVPLGLVELAYLSMRPAPERFDFAQVLCTSAATLPVAGVHSGVAPGAVEVVGWAGLDRLPARAAEPGLALVLSTVSAPTVTGGNASSDSARLYDAAVELRAAGWQVIVRPHPREQLSRWDGFALDQGATPAVTLARAQIALGVVGTTAYYTAALGVPLLGIVGTHCPDYLASLATALDDDVVADQAERARPVSAEHAAWVVGPVGGAAQRVCARWLSLAA